ncbi:nucleosome assembly protein 1-like 1-A [Dysidea avara]|uniref:nucleosome assembly protein 1-like 1-A n=1 Tax=Dysidea avara TaxID=196820 RepID=UPI00332B7344
MSGKGKDLSKKKLKVATQADAEDSDEAVDLQDLRQYLKTKVASELEMPKLPASIQRRINALKNLQLEHTKIEQEFFMEVQALEAKYATRFRPLLDRRSDIVMGTYEPTDKECEWKDEDDDDDDSSDKNKKDGDNAVSGLTDDMAKVAMESSADPAAQPDTVANKENEPEPVGIPDFWLTVLQNAEMLTDMIKEHDEPLLSHLINVKATYADQQGLDFTLEFHFTDNEYFTNKVLTKSYVVECKVDENDPFSFKGPSIIKTAGCKIDWKKGKNLTVKTVKKKQRHKGRGQTRTVTKTVPNESFFTFFDPPEAPQQDDDDDDDGDEDYLVMEALEADFTRAEYFRDEVIPEAVLFFTGEKMEDYDETDEEEDDDDLEDEDDDKFADPDPDNPQGQKPAECKQQ